MKYWRAGRVASTGFLTILLAAVSFHFGMVEACGPEDTPSQSPANTDVRPLVGRWHSGEILGLSCSEQGHSFMGFRTKLGAADPATDFVVAVSQELCLLLGNEQERAFHLGYDNLFLIQIYIDASHHMVAFQSSPHRHSKRRTRERLAARDKLAL